MQSRTLKGLVVLSLVAILMTGCGSGGLSFGKTVTIPMIYGSEKEAWLVPLVQAFNAEKHKTEGGAVIVVEATAMGSIESGDRIVEGLLEPLPVVWSPASSAYVPVTNVEWRKTHAEDLVVGTPNDLVLSPVVIAMWQPMAETLGWPGEPIGWTDIAEMATSVDGWSGYGYPEWGDFKLGHTHPNFSNSGIISVIAEAYAGAGKQRDLTMADLDTPEVISFMSAVESSIIHYGESTGFFADRMFQGGPSYLSAAVLYENLVVEEMTRQLNGTGQQLPVVAIYPKEGTFWSNHPYIILNAPWVTEEQKEAAAVFQDYLLAEPQQRKAIAYGFRPADPAIPLSSPLDIQHGVDPMQPQTVLEVPSAEVVVGIQALWQQQAKKPVDLVVVMDISGSMKGDKINAARASLRDFINLLDDRDRLQVILFSDELVTLTPLSSLGEKREEVLRRVSGIMEQGDTRLYDAVQMAYGELEANGDPQHIRAIVTLTDGNDTASQMTLDQLMGSVGNLSEGGNATKVFTIAFGDNADEGVLQRIAESTGAKQYNSDPQTIHDVYAEIATFF
ncbi:MAG: VWA domain-containing protein [Anaerolineae bacterium]|nr:VWA domain-containing protein [Anaerolineae bacterium]